jgi:TM2 domain-containing membrane protein YozV
MSFASTCRNCGNSLMPGGPMQPFNQQGKHPGNDKKILAGIMGIIFGGFGVHKFILGYTNEGVIMLVTYFAGLLLCGIPSLVIVVIGIIEGIMYLTKSDEEFYNTYIQNKKPWF